MSRVGLFVFAVLAALAAPAFTAGASPEPVRTLPLGAAAPDFELPGVDGEKHRLADFADAKLLAIIFTCNHCPTAQAYESRIKQLEVDYRDRGVAVVAISSNDPKALRLDELGYTDLGDSLAEMKLRAEEQDFQFPYLYDGETQQTARAYGAQATPHAFLFDADRKLRYVGRIDDSDVKTVTSHDLRNAIDELLAGKEVTTPQTRVVGCSTKWSAKQADVAAADEQWNQRPVELKVLDEATIKKIAANDTDKLILVNLWATWCAPCVAELPEFVTLNRMYGHRKFELVTISLDQLEQQDAALKVLKDKHLSATNYINGIESLDTLAEALDPKWGGPTPYTLLIAPGGEIIYRHTDTIDPLEMRRKIVEFLGRTYANKSNP